MDDAYQAYRSGKWAAAIPLFDNELRENYSNSRARYYLAECFARTGQTTFALILYQQCISMNNDPAVVSCSRAAIYRLNSAANQARAAEDRFNAPSNAPANASAPASTMLGRSPSASAPLTSQPSFQFTPLTGVRTRGDNSYDEPKEAMDTLVSLAQIPTSAGLGAVADAHGARLDNQYLSSRKQALDKYCQRLDQLRRDSMERIRVLTEKARSDKADVPTTIVWGSKRISNPDYATIVGQIDSDCKSQVASVNQRLNSEAMEIAALAQREITNLDNSHSSIAEQVNSKGGISKMTSQGTGMFVRNFIHYGGDDSEPLLPDYRASAQSLPPALKAVPGRLIPLGESSKTNSPRGNFIPAGQPKPNSLRPLPGRGNVPGGYRGGEDKVDVWR